MTREYRLAPPEKLGRRISRRLSLVARVPTMLQSKLRLDAIDAAGELIDAAAGHLNLLRWPRRSKAVSVTLMLHDGRRRVVRDFP